MIGMFKKTIMVFALVTVIIVMLSQYSVNYSCGHRVSPFISHNCDRMTAFRMMGLLSISIERYKNANKDKLPEKIDQYVAELSGAYLWNERVLYIHDDKDYFMIVRTADAIVIYGRADDCIVHTVAELKIKGFPVK